MRRIMSAAVLGFDPIIGNVLEARRTHAGTGAIAINA